jgi:hypothetical protein
LLNVWRPVVRLLTSLPSSVFRVRPLIAGFAVSGVVELMLCSTDRADLLGRPTARLKIVRWQFWPLVVN